MRFNPMLITGLTIKELGYKPASWWKDAIAKGSGKAFNETEARTFLDAYVPVTISPYPKGERKWFANIDPDTDLDKANFKIVSEHMNELVRTPTVVAAAIMPDACPSDHRLGAIPVGGI